MTKDDLLSELFAMQRAGIKPGLERTAALSALRGNPHLRFPSVHVAGTNGKGTSCALIASVLTQAGYKTGLYTSPHVKEFNERIRVDGEMISDEDIVRYAFPLLESAKAIEGTFFEITTVMAFEYFADKGVDIAVIETGMGGRFDSTNILTPLVSVITDVGMDHAEYLGDSIEKIAMEKAGIIKPGVPAVISQGNTSFRDIFQEATAAKPEIIFAGERCRSRIESISDSLAMRVKTETAEASYLFDFPHAGAHQLRNLDCAITALELIRNDFPWSGKDMTAGAAALKRNTGHAGRIEVIDKNKPLILDVSHNEASVRGLVDTLKSSPHAGKGFSVVFGAMKDKDLASIISILTEIADEIIFVKPDVDRAASVEQLALIAGECRFMDMRSFISVAEGCEYLIAGGKPGIICGSFFTVSEALPVVKKYYPAF